MRALGSVGTVCGVARSIRTVSGRSTPTREICQSTQLPAVRAAQYTTKLIGMRIERMSHISLYLREGGRR